MSIVSATGIGMIEDPASRMRMTSIEAPDIQGACEDYKALMEKARKGELINFRDIVLNEKDLHLRRPENRSQGWRYVL